MSDIAERLENERIEIQLLLEGLFLKYGHDFRDYAGAHLKRRMEYRKLAEGLDNYAEMLHKILYDQAFLQQLLLDLSINITEMFRDPWVYAKIRKAVVPHLKTYPFIRSWHAGCSTGQEVYSMCILFHEEEVSGKRIQIYATDFNDLVLDKARQAIFPIEVVKEYTANYQKAGGLSSFAEYYTADYESVKINPPLRDRVLFSAHNLATDGVFAEMNIIFCRNVLIYFNKELQNKVMKLFYDSLCPGGFLCLGPKESLRFTDYADKFDIVGEKERIYRKKRGLHQGLSNEQ
ncbi:MAG: chemotaxis protein CheR [Desulfobacterales bacterium GWB2_56_26]|nr:MAG: chemotaxis protein CheR [Desulfobacterales bacterium GWB2_56_26]